MSLRQIHLHGRLGEQFGPTHRFAVETIGESVRAFEANFPGFAVALHEGAYEVVRGEYDLEKGMWLEESHIKDFRLGDADLHFVPVIEGSKNAQAGGSLKVILGVALVGGAFLLSGGALATPLLGGLFTYGNAAVFGAALAFAGIATILSPKQQNPYEQNSFALAGPGNSYAQGNPVPLVYGEVICGSQLVSGALDVEDIPVNWDPTAGNTNIGTYDPQTGQGVISGLPTSYTQPSGNT